MKKKFFTKIILLCFFANITFLSCTLTIPNMNVYLLKKIPINLQKIPFKKIAVGSFLLLIINDTILTLSESLSRSKKSSMKAIIHESSHAVAHYVLFKKAPLRISVSNEGSHITAIDAHPYIHDFLDSPIDDSIKNVFQRIIVSMAGVAGEAVFMNNGCDTWEKAQYNTTAQSDILYVFELKRILESFMQNKQNELTKLGYPEESIVNLPLLYEKTKELLKKNESSVVRLFNILKNKNIAFEEEMISTFNNYEQNATEKFNGIVSNKIIYYDPKNFISLAEINKIANQQDTKYKIENKIFTLQEIEEMRNEDFFDKKNFFIPRTIFSKLNDTLSFIYIKRINIFMSLLNPFILFKIIKLWRAK